MPTRENPLAAPSADHGTARLALQVPLATLARLFDAVHDVVFFVKDADGRYVHANTTLTQRLRKRSAEALIGRRSDELFPEPLGSHYTAQDMRVVQQGIEIVDQLELHLFPSGSRGWCMTQKFALRDDAGAVVGLLGISRDLAPPNRSHSDYAGIAAVVERLRRSYAQPLRIGALARDAGLSIVQLERHVQRVFYLTPRQLLAKIRLDAALAALDGDDSIAGIAHACGYTDQSAFTRYFRTALGMTPSQYRKLRLGQPQRRGG